tara:strand:- start:4152 stop:4364 length:213 start_codon:yes stop_codon:yes gene_type:complete
MGQSKVDSFKESVVNVVIGGLISVVIQTFLFPILGVEATLVDNVVIWVVFASVSVIRGYVVRRWFNKEYK